LIRVYTKTRHIKKIEDFLSSQNIPFETFTVKDESPKTNFDLGVSYCYPRKISKSLLSIPKKGFVNYHPAPLPKYKGPTELDDAIKNKETDWGVTVHHMNEEYDSGEIIKMKQIKLHEHPTSAQELGAVSHYFLFDLFKETILEMYN
jgi:methionyl-tRNA formyltransferase